MRVPRTFVFVDLSGFTNYTAANGDDAAGRLLGAFRSITREVASERGRAHRQVARRRLHDRGGRPGGVHRVRPRARAPLGRGVRPAARCGSAWPPVTPCCSRATTTSGRPSTWPPACATPPVPFEVLLPTMQIERLPRGRRGHLRSATSSCAGSPGRSTWSSSAVRPVLAASHDTGELWTRTPFI